MQSNGIGHLWTIEGSPQVAAIADETLRTLNFASRASVIRGPFHQKLLPTIVERRFDLVFVDGHHDGAATLRYFEQIKPRLQRGAIVIFDDIEWSDDMRRAWMIIAADPAVGEHHSKFGMGLILHS
jgi:predicted O-methyltransferase YrrM